MNAPDRRKEEEMWTIIEAEKRKDRLIRRISIVAWSVAGLTFLTYASLVGYGIVQALRLVEVGIMRMGDVIGLMLPLVTIVGLVSLLIAVLSTVGIFVRLRTSSLHEIRLRLAALEELIVAGGDATAER